MTDGTRRETPAGAGDAPGSDSLESGSDEVMVDPYVFSTLLRDLVGHDRQPSAYLVYVYLLGLDRGRPLRISLSRLAETTGLSRRSVQKAVAHLEQRGLLDVQKGGPAAESRYRVRRPWIR